MEVGDVLFGRYARVTFTNLDTGVVIEVDSSLKIEFEYHKSIDENETASTGKIVIHGLTESTFNQIGERLRCAVELTVGYTQSESAAPRSIISGAALKNKSFDSKRGGSVSTFDIDGNFYYLRSEDKVSKTLPDDVRLLSILDELARDMGLGYRIKLEGILKTDQFVDFFSEYTIPLGITLTGNVQNALNQVCDAYGFEYSIDKEAVNYAIKQSDIARWYDLFQRSLKPNTQAAKNEAELAAIDPTKLPKNESLIAVSGGKATVVKESRNFDLSDNVVVVLSPTTGLLNTPITTTVEATKAYDEALAPDEEIVKQVMQEVKRYKSGENKGQIVTDGDGNTKLTKKPNTKTIARKSVEVECLINPVITLQDQVELSFSNKALNGIYRVRDITYSGDTRGGAWMMKMILNKTR